MLVEVSDLVCCLELFVVVVGHAERLADIVDAILVGVRLSPPGASSPTE